MTDPEFNYEVAFSFLDADEPIAARLAELLRNRMSVFVYSERQEDLAGRDGVEVFADVFKKQARVCVVLYRDGWGDTKWTRIEAESIKARALEEGWGFLLVIMISGKPPSWLPSTKLWLGFERYREQGAAAVIESKVLDGGGLVKVETALEMAQRVEREEKARKELELFYDSAAGRDAVDTEIEKLFTYLHSQVQEMQTRMQSCHITFNRYRAHVVAVSSPGRSFSIGKIPVHSNPLKYPSLFLREFEESYAHIGPRAGRKPCNEVRITYAVDEHGIPGWIEEDDPERMFSSTALAEKYLIIVLDHARDEPSSWSPPDSDEVDDEYV